MTLSFSAVRNGREMPSRSYITRPHVTVSSHSSFRDAAPTCAYVWVRMSPGRTSVRNETGGSDPEATILTKCDCYIKLGWGGDPVSMPFFMPRRGQLWDTSGLVLALLLVAGLPRSAAAQAVTATLVGTVRDTSQAVMPGVTVTATQTGTNAVRTALTNQRGNFTIAGPHLGN